MSNELSRKDAARLLACLESDLAMMNDFRLVVPTKEECAEAVRWIETDGYSDRKGGYKEVQGNPAKLFDSPDPDCAGIEYYRITPSSARRQETPGFLEINVVRAVELGYIEVHSTAWFVDRALKLREVRPGPEGRFIFYYPAEAMIDLRRAAGMPARRSEHLADVPASEPKGNAKPKPDSETGPPLTDTEERVLKIITAIPEGKGITGCAIVDRLKKQGYTHAQSTLTRHTIPKLKQWHGVENRRGVGYYCRAT